MVGLFGLSGLLDLYVDAYFCTAFGCDIHGRSKGVYWNGLVMGVFWVNCVEVGSVIFRLDYRKSGMVGKAGGCKYKIYHTLIHSMS